MTDSMTIKTDHKSRDVLSWYDLTAKEQAEFDYLDDVEAQSYASFFRYKGWVYDLGEFMAISRTTAPHPQRKGWETWDGYASDSFFSGVLVKYTDDCESVFVATYYC